MTKNIPEKLVVKIWQHRLLERTDLVTEEGEPIRVIYPGRLNDNRGADLLDAVIATNQGLIKGDVEVHVKSSDWWAHGHHQDTHFNRVILHVVGWHNAGTTTNLQNGELVCTLALKNYIKNLSCQYTGIASTPASVGMSCRRIGTRLNKRSIGELLDSAGTERFLDKVARFQADLAHVEAGQVVYQGMMYALGYAKNKLSFLQLAQSVPLQSLESMAQAKITDEEYLARQQALLLGTAGLLPSQRSNWCHTNKDSPWVREQEQIWASCHQNQAMSEKDWTLFKVRPNNLPIRRIAAMTHLTLRYREKGILREIINIIRELPVNTAHPELEKALSVTTNGYWANHLDFGLPLRLIMPTLLGSSRAAAIVANIILPFTFAFGKHTSQPELSGKALCLYHHYPRLPSNTIERHMKNQIGLNNDIVDSAQRQQGLIHVYKTLCSQGKCRHCPLGTAGT